MEIKTAREGDVLVFSFIGRLDGQTVIEAEKHALSWLDTGEKKLVGDFGGLEYISSAGLRLILLMAKKLKSIEGKLCLFGLPQMVKEVFEIAGFQNIIPLTVTKDKALEMVS